ncbi:MAG: TssN family type VI secretion system protein [Flavobacteriales bacterium]
MKTLGLSAIMLIVTLLLLLVFMRSKPGINKKQVLKYSLLMLVVFALFAIYIFMNDNMAFSNYLLLQGVSILVGGVHCYVMFIVFKWSSRDSFWTEMWFTTFIASLAATVFILVATFIMSPDEQAANSVVVWYSTAFIAFIIPYLVLKSFDYMWNLPPHMYKLWHYPIGAEVPDALEYDLADHMKIIAIELEPEPGAEAKNNKVKAPERMELGHYFMSFIEQYNLRNPEQPITVQDENKMPNGWLFTLKTKWYKKSRVFDPEMTFNDNNIKENDVILAERVNY